MKTIDQQAKFVNKYQLRLKNYTAQNGVSLIELLVALTIGLFVSIAVFSVLSMSEARKRSTTTKNDINQIGAYAIYQIDQAIRSAGSGLGSAIPTVQDTVTAYGCQLNVARNGLQTLPATFPAPFNTVDQNVRLAPALILDGGAGGSDIIISMSGAGGLAEVPSPFIIGYVKSAADNSNLKIENNASFRANDRVLLVGRAVNTACFVSQIDAKFTASSDNSSLNLAAAFVDPNNSANTTNAGEYYQATINGSAISSADGYVLNLGQTPTFNMLGVGTNNTLMLYNLLQAAAANGANPSRFIENVFQMQAIYGVDADNNPQTAVVWQAPTGDFSYANLQANAARLATIEAIKIALIMRTDLQEKTQVSNSNLTIFADTTISQNISLANTNFRYQVFETTIPIINTILH